MNGDDNNNIKNDQFLVSVIMNCYNGERYLCEAIDSVLAQTYENWEIIFWDNQSTDKSAEIFNGYEDKRLKYYYAPHHTSLGRARNEAVKKANGIWLGFLDVDDMWISEKLQKQIEIINKESDRLGLVYGQSKVLIADHLREKISPWAKNMRKYATRLRIITLPEGRIFEQLLRGNFIPLVSAIVSREAFINVGGVNSLYKYSEDFDLFVKISEKYLVRAVQSPIAIYRVHGANSTEYNLETGFHESFEIISRYLPNVFAKRAICQYCAMKFLQSIKLKNVGMLLIIMKKCNIGELIVYLFNICRIYLIGKISK